VKATDGPAAWHEVAGHLVQGHEADAGEIVRYAPTTRELHAEHDCAHAHPSLFPHTPHEHGQRLPAGDPYWTPFPASNPAAAEFLPWTAPPAAGREAGQ
jgi:hypothetical protein